MNQKKNITTNFNEDEFREQVLQDYRHYCTAALRLEQLYKLLDMKHHELTAMATHLEKNFAELHKKIYREEQSLRHHFKATVEKVCDEKRELDMRQNNAFFRW
jgi:hypothetical protein